MYVYLVMSSSSIEQNCLEVSINSMMIACYDHVDLVNQFVVLVRKSSMKFTVTVSDQCR